MANPIHIVINGVASIISVLILYTIFGPIVNNSLYSLVLDTMASPDGMLTTNAGALSASANYTILAMNVMPWFVCGVVLFRIFAYVSFRTEEQTYG